MTTQVNDLLEEDKVRVAQMFDHTSNLMSKYAQVHNQMTTHGGK